MQSEKRLLKSEIFGFHDVANNDCCTSTHSHKAVDEHVSSFSMLLNKVGCHFEVGFNILVANIMNGDDLFYIFRGNSPCGKYRS